MISENCGNKFNGSATCAHGDNETTCHYEHLFGPLMCKLKTAFVDELFVNKLTDTRRSSEYITDLYSACKRCII